MVGPQDRDCVLTSSININGCGHSYRCAIGQWIHQLVTAKPLTDTGCQENPYNPS